MTTGIQNVSATLDGEITVYGLSPRVLEHCTQRFALPNPKYLAAVRFGSGYGITEPEFLYAAITMPDGSFHIPRGMWQMLRIELIKFDIKPVMTIDARSNGSPIRRRNVEIPFEPRPYQRDGVRLAKEKQQGLIVLPPGTGKSKLGLGTIIDDSRTTMILVPTNDIGDQWELDGIEAGFDVGRVGDGRAEWDRGIVIITNTSAIAALEADPTLGQRFGRIIVDEVHHAAANGLQRALRLLPAKFRLGLTATLMREDRLTDFIYWAFGDVLLERTTKEMIQQGYLMPAEIEIISTGFKWSYDGPEKKRLATLEKDVAEDLARNVMIAERVAAAANRGESCLVLARERAHVRELARLIERHGNIECRALTGQTSKKKRKGTVGDLRSGKLMVATATSLADEGLDIQRLSVIALAAPQRAEGRTWQKLGRLLRIWKGKKPKLIDFVDDDVDMLASRATARRRVYREAGLLP